MNVTVVGAGNIGIYLSVIISNNGFNVNLYTSKKFDSTTFYVEDVEHNRIISSNRINVVADLNTAIKDADYIFITYPMFLRKKFITDSIKFVKKNVTFVFVPNGVGSEFFYDNIRKVEGNIVGFQRVPAICRLRENNYVMAMSVKDKIYISGFPNRTNVAIDRMLDNEVIYLESYALVSFTASNPILHTIRLCCLFKNADLDTKFKRRLKFYSTWNDESSQLLIACDYEMRKILNFILNTDSSSPSILEHYGVSDYKSLTNKLKSIASFKNIYAPLKKNEKYYVIDVNSRYFQEDFLYGLCVIKGYGILCNIETPNIDFVISWFQRLVGKEYVKDGMLGEDFAETGMPQVYGIKSIEDVYILKK